MLNQLQWQLKYKQWQAKWRIIAHRQRGKLLTFGPKVAESSNDTDTHKRIHIHIHTLSRAREREKEKVMHIDDEEESFEWALNLVYFVVDSISLALVNTEQSE